MSLDSGASVSVPPTSAAKPYTEIKQIDRHSKNNPLQEIWHLSLTASKNAGKNLTTFLGLVFW
jgi:hypothetical protein